MATRQTGMTAETAAQVPSRAMIEAEVSRQLAEIDQETESDEIEMTSADRISEMLQTDLGEKAYVRVYKHDERTGAKQFCKDYQTAEFEENGNELIRTEWGYGKYSVVLYGTIPGTKRFTIRAKQELMFAKPALPTAVAVAPPQQNSELSQVLSVLVEGQNKMLQALTTQPQKDPMEEMTKMLTLMTTMREAMGLNNQPQQKSSVQEIVDAIKELKGASDLIGGGGEKEPNMMTMASEVLSVVKPLIAARAQQPEQQAFPQLTVPASFAPTHAENQHEEPPSDIQHAQQSQPIQQTQLPEDDPDMLEFLAFAARLKKDFLPNAGDTSKVQAMAELLEAKAPEQFFEVLEAENWFEALQQYSPQFFPALVPVLESHKEWLTAVRDKLLELLKDEE